MLNSAEHEILTAHKYKHIKTLNFFSGSGKPKMLFFLLINVKCSGKISCSAELNIKIFFITSGPYQTPLMQSLF